jgi:hypothetical protein
MIAARSLPTFTITFAAAYAILYVTAVEYNLALFTYHPAAEEFHFLVQPAKDGPAMYWYGWMASSALGSFSLAVIASWLPGGATTRLWSGWSWVVPLGVMAFFCYILRGFFIR